MDPGFYSKWSGALSKAFRDEVPLLMSIRELSGDSCRLNGKELLNRRRQKSESSAGSSPGSDASA